MTDTKVRVPWCDCGTKGGFSNARYRETGKLKDQWLCGDCWRPARAIFHDTIRWAAERIEWYGGTHADTRAVRDQASAGPLAGVPARDPARGRGGTDSERVQRGLDGVEAVAEPESAAGAGDRLVAAGRDENRGAVHVMPIPPVTVTEWGSDGDMLTVTESLVTTFPDPITGERADLLPLDEVAEIIHEGNEHRSWGDCLRLARALTDISWAWIQEDPR